MMYLLGEKYLTSLEKLAQSNNSKLVLLPADLQQTLGAMLGKVSGQFN
jgi:regulator of protease activity HflC (stomatin/prohibitin superfamily)